MKIKSIKTYTANLSLSKAYEIAFQYTDTVENGFIEIELENGIVGLGSCATSIHVLGTDIEGLKKSLSSPQLQEWKGRDIREFRLLRQEASIFLVDNSSALTAVDIALHDAFAKHLDISVLKLYGQKVKPIATSVTIGISDVEETLKEARDYVDIGFKVLKVKTGKDLQIDIERCIKLREVFKNRITIRTDGNQGYSFEETIEFYNRTKDLNIELIEQPMKVGLEESQKKLPESIRSIIAADESLKTPTAAMSLLSGTPACGIFNIKIMKCGGLTGAFEIATIAKASKIELFWGCYDESRISISAALQAALVCQNTKYLDLDGELFLDEDVVTGGFRFNQGVMIPLDKPGFGCELK